jgi:glycosyltransferase involved in cell wall biosynthesis
MKKILFVINSLDIGGSEKSLVSLLNLIDYTKYDVDLMLFKKGGEFEKFIPKGVNIIEQPKYYSFITERDKNFSLIEKIKFLYFRLKTTSNLRLNSISTNKIQTEQILYKSQKNVFAKLEKEYDVAIAYSQGLPTYFVVDKVKAKKKIAWINCDYVNTKYDKNIDKSYYRKMDNIVVVSKSVRESIIQHIPEYENKIELVFDIVDPKLIEEMAEQRIDELGKNSFVIILTVGRLITHHKGYDTAVKAARLLKERNYKFRWFVVGEGEDRKEIESLINKMGLQDEFILLGKKENPYPYMKNCDLYVQPSKKEGFGLTVIEAKILKKPIICTNFNTANEILNNGKDGLIVGHTEEELFVGIQKYMDDPNFRSKVIQELNKIESYSSTKEIKKIYNLMNEDNK